MLIKQVKQQLSKSGYTQTALPRLVAYTDFFDAPLHNCTDLCATLLFGTVILLICVSLILDHWLSSSALPL